MSQAPLPMLLPPAEPEPGVAYPQVLRTASFNPVRSIFGVLAAISMYVLFVPVAGQLLLQVFWLLRGQPDRAAYIRAASAYELPEGLVAGHLALALLIGISLLVYRYAHSVRPRWLWSVQPGVRWRYLIACLLVALVVLNGVLWLSLIGEPAQFGSPQAGWIWFILATVLFSPLQATAEEVFFRGYLLQGIGSLSVNKWLPIVPTALLFALFHGVQNWALFADRFAFGLLAGGLVVLTGGLEAGIAAHIVNNVFAFGYAVFTGGVAALKATQQLTWTQAAWDIAGFALFALVAWWVARRMNVATVTPG